MSGTPAQPRQQVGLAQRAGQRGADALQELVADPVAKMREVYEKLGREGFEAALPAFEAQGRAMKAYRTNTYRHDPRIVAEISRRWQPFLDRYGYSAPST